MDKQTDLFMEDSHFTLVNESDKSDIDVNSLKIHQTELKEIRYSTAEELFSGFNTLKVITFSYSLNFINSIISMFDKAEIIIGGNFLVEKDQTYHDFLAEIFSNNAEIPKLISKFPNISAMMRTNNIEVRTPNFLIDHRKLYLLQSDEGRTRVISASANFTGKAWNNDILENITCDDSEYAYDIYSQEFDVAWSTSSSIIKPVESSKKADKENTETEPLKDCALLKKIKETGKTIVLQYHEGTTYSIDNIKYTIDRRSPLRSV